MKMTEVYETCTPVLQKICSNTLKMGVDYSVEREQFNSDLLLKIEQVHRDATIRSELFYKRLVGGDNAKEYCIRRVIDRSSRIFVGVKIGDNLRNQVCIFIM